MKRPAFVDFPAFASPLLLIANGTSSISA